MHTADILPDWSVEETEAANSSETKHLWEESWDDDDTSDDFSQQLKYVHATTKSAHNIYIHMHYPPPPPLPLDPRHSAPKLYTG